MERALKLERETAGVAIDFEPGSWERALKLERETAGVAIDFEPGSWERALKLERETGFEPATSTLARLRSTN